MNYDEKINKIIEELKRENKVLPMTVDVIFKDVLQDKQMKGILAYLISEVIEINYVHVLKNLEFRNTELLNEKALEKRKTSDLIVDIDKMTVNLEMNATDKEELILKNNLYHHNLAARSLKKGEPYINAKKIIQINFDKINKYDDRIIIKFTMRDEEGKYIIDENYTNYHINMAKAYDKWYNKEKLSKFEKILLIMMLENKDDLLEVSKGEKELENMVWKIFEESEDPNMIGVYDKEEMQAWMSEVGKEIAMEKGQKEEKNAIAKNMLSKGMNIDTISEITELSVDEIKNLQ